RACPVEVLCEGACVMHRYNKKPIEIGRLQRFAMEDFHEKRKPGAPVPVRHAEKIACIGGGPASIACAAELRQQGFAVTVFDNRPLPGGLATYGVAEYKLRPSDSLREVEMVRDMGVEFRRAEVGKDVPLDALEREYAFVFLGMGLGAMDMLGIPGEDTRGVIDALRFIERYKTQSDLPVGRIVAVIGGGNTAIDAANAAVRLGAEEVHIFYRRTEKEMPAFPFEYDHAKVEAVHFHWLAQPVEILAPNGRAEGVRFVKTALGTPDATGRRNAEPVQGSEFVFPCDMVIPALGQSRFLELLRTSRGITIEKRAVAVDRPTGRTTNPKYFAGGDCVNGGREVVDAVADGKRAARAIAQEVLHG
ncbi:MAG: FAD-dependent oxidoreductase, partial [Spirochaetia bacterium]